MFLYPACYRADVYDMDARQMGIYTGATLHEVAHVYGAGEAMNGMDELHDSAYERMRAVQTEMNEAVEQYRLQYPESAAELKAAQQRICTDCETLVATMRGSEESGGQKVDIKQPAVIVKMLRVILLAPVLIVLSFILSRRAQQTDGKARVQMPAFAVFFLIRFLLEFIKNDQAAFEADMVLNMGQLLSIPFILLGIGFIVYSFVKPKHK
jgi:uncharacterized membrane protein YadS